VTRKLSPVTAKRLTGGLEEKLKISKRRAYKYSIGEESVKYRRKKIIMKKKRKSSGESWRR
jgi:hypothetical protein